MIINNNSDFTNVFEELPIGCALDMLRSELHQKHQKTPILNSRKSLIKRKLINKKSKLTNKGKVLLGDF